MAGSRRKSSPIKDVDGAVKNYIEERNYLIFSLAERDPVKIKELNTWSLEAFYQYLYANSIHAKRIEDRKNNDIAKRKALARK